eukprot:Hpha_TRINITY_DN16342_c3_g3::TRINITY_DN16342_c3_g3_i5::g.58419::m.58419/K08517/SEC22; vesicle transport protein SEC22
MPPSQSLILSTTIVRLRDGLVLCQAIVDGGSKQNAEHSEGRVLKHLAKEYAAGQLPSQLTLEGSGASFHVVEERGVGFATCCVRQFRKEQAYAYLRDLCKEFSGLYSTEKIESATRPYSLIAFDKYIQKTIRVYQTPHAAQQVNALKKELGEVRDIMSKSLEEVIGRGEKLETLQTHSQMLKHESGQYHRRAVQLNRWHWLRTWGVPAAVCSSVTLLLMWRFGLLFFLF